jgi:hypothetical protein
MDTHPACFSILARDLHSGYETMLKDDFPCIKNPEELASPVRQDTDKRKKDQESIRLEEDN